MEDEVEEKMTLVAVIPSTVDRAAKNLHAALAITCLKSFSSVELSFAAKYCALELVVLLLLLLFPPILLEPSSTDSLIILLSLPPSPPFAEEEGGNNVPNHEADLLSGVDKITTT